MACITHARGIDVSAIFTTGANTIVTGDTVVDETTVINGYDLSPRVGDMTAITFECGANVSARFTFGIYTVMTTGA